MQTKKNPRKVTASLPVAVKKPKNTKIIETKPASSLSKNSTAEKSNTTTPVAPAYKSRFLMDISEIVKSNGLDSYLIPVWPPSLTATLLDKNSNPVVFVQVEALMSDDQIEEISVPRVDNYVNWKISPTCTDATGRFKIKLPVIASKKGLKLKLTGRENTKTEIYISYNDIAKKDGNLGIITVNDPPKPFNGLIGQLGEVVDDVNSAFSQVDSTTQGYQDQDSARPKVKLGEGETSYSLQWASGAIESYRFSILHRLVEPEVSREVLLESHIGNSDSGSLNRIPISSPIDVQAFRQKIEISPKQILRSSTLGLGYFLRMHQSWKPTHLSLGDLVYSLPLAPGEEQRIAVLERSETISVQDRETMSADEYQSYLDKQDTSTDATFHSALRDFGFGGSFTKSRSESAGYGLSTGAAGEYMAIMTAGISFGGGFSDTTASSSSWESFSRDYASQATEDFHQNLARQASARRTATRVGIRLASANENEQVTTKVIANHNHSHALTMQYWEVLRNYDVVTEVDDVQLVCYIPMELMRFLPAGEEHIWDSSTLVSKNLSADQIRHRYSELIKYYDVITPWLRGKPELAEGLRLLKKFAAYPIFSVQNPTESIMGMTMKVNLQGGFLSFDNIYASLILKNGSRIGPVQLYVNGGGHLDDDIASQSTRQELIHTLSTIRHNRSLDFSGNLSIPGECVESDFVRFELSWRPRAASFKLVVNPIIQAALLAPEPPSGAEAVAAFFPGGLSLLLSDHVDRVPALVEALKNPVVNLSPSQIQNEIGGPIISTINIFGQLNASSSVKINYVDVNEEIQIGIQPLPLPMGSIQPMMSYKELLKIEAVFQHVIENTLLYSRAVWMGLTPDERALMLEGYTIGLPGDEIFNNPTQDVPLLNCVSNELLGFYGNCMIMPFSIPPQAINEVKTKSEDGIQEQPLTTASLQTALLRFHRQGFLPPRSQISLPTRGVLGEAVLGASNASEKIDLTRFWNWQDSPIDHADTITQAVLTQQSLIPSSAVQAPDKLATTTPSMITINSVAPEQIPDIIGKLTPDNLTKGSTIDFTGLSTTKELALATTNKAAEARQQVIDASEKLAEKALDSYVQLKGSKTSGSETSKESAGKIKSGGTTTPNGGGTTTPSGGTATPSSGGNGYGTETGISSGIGTNGGAITYVSGDLIAKVGGVVTSALENKVKEWSKKDEVEVISNDHHFVFLGKYPDEQNYYPLEGTGNIESNRLSTNIVLVSSGTLAPALGGAVGYVNISWVDNCILHADNLGTESETELIQKIRFRRDLEITDHINPKSFGSNLKKISIAFKFWSYLEINEYPPRVETRMAIKIIGERVLGGNSYASFEWRLLDPRKNLWITDNPDGGSNDFSLTETWKDI